MYSGEDNRTDVIILGGGPGGMSALLWCNSLGLSATLVERAPELGGQMLHLHHRVIDYPGLLPDNGRALRDAFTRQLEALGLDFRLDCRVQEINLQRLDRLDRLDRFDGSYPIEMYTSLGTLRSRALVLATGARKRRLGIPGEDEFEGRGVSYSATRDHPKFAGREVAVIGGGDSAVENSLILARVCPRVTLIHRHDVFRARPEWVEEARNHPRITIRTGLVLREIRGRDSVEGLILEEISSGHRETLAAAGVFIRLGIEPNTEILRGHVTLDDAGYVIVDSRQQTSKPFVYGVGDVTRPVCLSIATAVGHGATAAKAIAEVLRREHGKRGKQDTEFTEI